MEKNIKILTKMKNTVSSNIVKYIMLQFKMALFHVNTWSNVIYSCNAALYFQHHYFSLQCPSEIIIIC